MPQTETCTCLRLGLAGEVGRSNRKSEFGSGALDNLRRTSHMANFIGVVFMENTALNIYLVAVFFFI